MIFAYWRNQKNLFIIQKIYYENIIEQFTLRNHRNRSNDNRIYSNIFSSIKNICLEEREY